MNKIAERLATAALILAAFAALTISTLDLVGVDVSATSKEDPAVITLLVVGLLCAGIGIERVAINSRQLAALESVNEFVVQSPKVRRIEGREQIYNDAIRLVKQAERHIRSIVVGEPVKSPEAFADAVATRLQEITEKGQYARFDIVAIIDEAAIPNFRQDMRKRLSRYEDHGVGEQVNVYIINDPAPIGMDVLLIDRKHSTLSFTPSTTRAVPMSSIVFEDQPDVTERLVDWFVERVLSNATPLNSA